MAKSSRAVPATTVKQYLDRLPKDRRETLSAVREVVLRNLPDGYEEGIGFGAITYAVPLKTLPNTYNGEPLCVAALASLKNHCAIYLMAAYGDSKIRKWFETEFKKSGKKLDMGKACVRFKTTDDLPLDLIGSVIAKVPAETYIQVYEASRRKSK